MRERRKNVKKKRRATPAAFSFFVMSKREWAEGTAASSAPHMISTVTYQCRGLYLYRYGVNEVSFDQFSRRLSLTAQNNDELSFRRGDALTIVNREDNKAEKEWWWAEKDGREGFVPRCVSYTKIYEFFNSKFTVAFLRNVFLRNTVPFLTNIEMRNVGNTGICSALYRSSDVAIMGTWLSWQESLNP